MHGVGLWFAAVLAGLPTGGAAAEPGAEVVEVDGAVHIRERVEWRHVHYRIRGDLVLHTGGTLVLDHATVELLNGYSREFRYAFEGGTLLSRQATIGGTKREGRIRQSNIELTRGEWEAEDTTVRYCYGITFGSGDQGGALTATRLTMGENPDSVIMSGRGRAVIRDSSYMISLNAYADRGGTGVLDLPVNTPVTRVFDGSNTPGAQYRLELINTRVPLWFVFANNVTMDGPPCELILRDCPAVIPSILGGNLTGVVRLPTPWPGDRTNAALTIGNLTWRTENRPVGIFTWGLYLWGDQTNLTIAGPTLICELMVWDGKVALVGTPGTYDAATTATTIEVGAPGRDSAAELTLRNAAIGRFAPGDPVTGQVTARGRARITIDHARTANLVLITKDSGAISLSDIERTGEIKVIADGGPVVLPHDAAPAAH